MKRTPLQRKTRLRARRPTPRTHKLVPRLTGKALEQLRSDCYWRDGGICQECGVRVSDLYPDWHGLKYHIAHIRNKRMHGDSLSNVRSLCGDCHRAEHGNPLSKGLKG